MLSNGAVAETASATIPEIQPGQRLRFLSFIRTVPGGAIQHFVHDPSLACAGKTIAARVVIVERELEDGRKKLYVDLHPVAEKATHRLVVMNAQTGIVPEGALEFETPAPLKGKILLCTIGTKIPDVQGPGGSREPRVVAERPAPSRTVSRKIVFDCGEIVEIKVPKDARAGVVQIATGDTQLDRYVEQGWTIGGESAGTVQLWKKEGEKTRTITHYRPKTATDRKRSKKR